MAYSEKILRRASEIIADRKLRAEQQAKDRNDVMTARYPEIADAEEKMRKTAYSLVNVIGMGDKAAQYIEQLKTENLSAQRKIKDVLISAGCPENYLEPEYTCPICSDTGFKNGRLCKCHIELLKQL